MTSSKRKMEAEVGITHGRDELCGMLELLVAKHFWQLVAGRYRVTIERLEEPLAPLAEGSPVLYSRAEHGGSCDGTYKRRVVEGPDAGSHLVVDQYDGTEQLTWHVRRTRRRVDQPSNVIPGTRFAAGEAVQFYRSGSSRKEPGIYLGDVRGFPKWCWVQPGLTERPGYSSRRLVVPVQDVYELPDSHRCPDCQQKWHKKTHPSEDEDRSEGGGR